MKRISVLIFIFLCIWKLDAQIIFPSVMGSFGGSTNNDNFSLTWTSGEPFFTTVSQNDIVITQGFNQTLVVTGESTTYVNLLSDYQISVFPNPTYDFLNVTLQSEKPILITLQLIDMQGKVLLKLDTRNYSETIDFSKYPSGSYLLRISNSKQEFKSFKIQKSY